MPGWTIYVAVVLAFVAALGVSGHTQVKSTQKGDSLLKTWVKGGSAGCIAMVAVIALFLLVANLINWLF